ncbi:unnamed protein product [Rotaria magnacalcarata]
MIFLDHFFEILQIDVIFISFYNSFQLANVFLSLIYTSPFCASKSTLINNQQIIGVCSDFRSLTRLIFDPCFPNYPSMIPSSNQTNLTSLKLIHTPRYNFNRMAIPSNTILRQVIANIRHIQFISEQCSSDVHIKEIGLKFPKLQTLKFSMKFISSFNEQLYTIGQSILIKMRSHLHYLHIYLQHENLLIMSMIPSESQLSEWLGYNQKRLLHVQAIKINRNELSAWT